MIRIQHHLFLDNKKKKNTDGTRPQEHHPPEEVPSTHYLLSDMNDGYTSTDDDHASDTEACKIYVAEARTRSY